MKNILDEVLSPRPPDILYHYTTQEGLLGIISSMEIWVTHTQYLNDQTEYLHAKKMLDQEIEWTLKTTTDAETERLLCEMKEGLDGIESINVCVSSFSAEKNSLSQWRAYSNTTSGFAIGFPGSFLSELAKNANFYLAECIYEEDDQREMIQALVRKVLEENLDRRNKEESSDLPRGGNLRAYLHRYAPILKNKSFSEEKEWRIISRPLSSKSDRFDHRPGNSMIIPYYRLAMIDSEKHMPISEVVIGPTPHKQQSRRSVESFLISQGLRNVPVTLSNIPYRNW